MTTAGMKYIADFQNGKDITFRPHVDWYGLPSVSMHHAGQVTLFDLGDAQNLINALSAAIANAEQMSEGIEL